MPGKIACQTLDFFIRFRSDVWYAVLGHPSNQENTLARRDVQGRRLFRHAVPGCFPELKGVLWLGLCAWAVSSRRARVFS